MVEDIIVHILKSAAQVAYAHGGGDSSSMHFAERFHLHAASERGEAVREQVEIGPHERHAQQDQCLDEDGDLAPMKHAAHASMDHVRQHDAQRERHHGKQIAYGQVEVALRKMHAEQQDVAGLRVGEHPVATHVGVHVHEAAHQGEDDAELYGLGYLPCSLHWPSLSLLNRAWRQCFRD